MGIVPARAACIDIGSNGIRGVVVEASGASQTVLWQERAPIRLGAGTFSSGRLDDDAVTRAIEALKRMRQAIEVLQPAHWRCVATSAVRDARNRARFVRAAEREAGVGVDVISGAEEARLVHLAVTRRLAMGGRPWLFLDVGGGSVEVSLGTSEGIQWTESRRLGGVRLLAQFAGLSPAKAHRLMRESIAAFRFPSVSGIAGLACTGGNIDELAKLCGRRADAGHTIRASDLKGLLDEMLQADDAARARQWDLKADRADVIVPAGLVYLHVARAAGISELTVPGVALKEGVILDLLDEGESPSKRTAYTAALALGRRYAFEETHGRQVERLATTLFDQLQGEHGLGARDRVILSTAALLHDVGRHVDNERHHKHSQYLIRQSELPGLTRREQELAAQVARYHRKSEPKPRHEAYRALEGADRHRVDVLSAILRVADALDRQHADAVKALQCQRHGKDLVLRIVTTGDVALEEWALAKKGGLFERVFDARIALHVEAPHG